MSMPQETLVERRVRYVLDADDQLVVVENVPARVCLETGEQFFSPQTVERLHQIIRSSRTPDRMLQTPVFDFAA